MSLLTPRLVMSICTVIVRDGAIAASSWLSLQNYLNFWPPHLDDEPLHDTRVYLQVWSLKASTQHSLGSSAAASTQSCSCGTSMPVKSKSASSMAHHMYCVRCFQTTTLKNDSNTAAIEPYHILPHVLRIQRGVFLFFIRRYVDWQLQHAEIGWLYHTHRLQRAIVAS